MSTRLRQSMLVAVICVTALLLAAWPLAAASPSPGIEGTVDIRTSAAPGVVGGPLEVLVGVVLLGLATAAVTVAWSRLAARGDAP